MANIEDLEADDRGDHHHPHHRRSGSRRLDKAGVPGGPVLTYDETLTDPHVVARDMIVDVDHPVIGAMQHDRATPTKFSDLDFSVRGPAPWLGQHTAEVLREAGVDDAEIDAAVHRRGPLRRPTPSCTTELKEQTLTDRAAA